jgi:Ca-activated chloride channel family protein
MRLPRPIKNSLLPLLLVFAAQKVCAQLAPADDFFNSGAQFYISNNIPAALERTESGLKLYPDDVKLKKLEELLKQQQNQQQQSQSQQNSKSQQNQQQNQQSQSSPQNSQDQKKPGEQKQNPADQKRDEPQRESQPQKSNGEKNENQNAENQPVAGQMTPEEAKKLLDSQKGNEQMLPLKPQENP